MSIKSILFNTDMVRAILDGRKTVTRRVAKFEKGFNEETEKVYPGKCSLCVGLFNDLNNIRVSKKPPYQPGDILYVRETWHKYIKRVGKGESCHLAEFYGYKASVENSEDSNTPWKPSIHMPKQAARIWLKVTNVRVERLQDITTDQIEAEGVEIENDYRPLNGEEKLYAFSQLWVGTVKEADIDRYGWDSNPWVWVIEFERCEKPIVQ